MFGCQSSSSLGSVELAYADVEDFRFEEESETDIVIPSYLRPSTMLTEKIIHQISSSIKKFRPSRSLAESLAEVECGSPYSPVSPNPVAEIDVVISGGGMKCYYVCGCIAILQQQLAHNNIKIARVSGASAGAWSALFITAGISTSLIIESYHQCAESPDRYLHDVYSEDLVVVHSILLLSCVLSLFLVAPRIGADSRKRL
jgi:hypothetical protein